MLVDTVIRMAMHGITVLPYLSGFNVFNSLVHNLKILSLKSVA